jgi:hypothetical protein
MIALPWIAQRFALQLCPGSLSASPCSSALDRSALRPAALPWIAQRFAQCFELYASRCKAHRAQCTLPGRLHPYGCALIAEGTARVASKHTLIESST